MAPPNDDKSLDILGVKPVGESLKTVVEGVVSGAAAFLSRICLPASEEFGLLLRDKVSAWRAHNLAKIAARAEKQVNARDTPCSASPRLLMFAVEQGSWAEDDEIQEMWAGLITSSCTDDGNDDSNLLFMNLLAQLSVPQVRILSYACARVATFVTKAGLVTTGELSATSAKLLTIAGIADLQRLDRELDHLRALDLLASGGGFNVDIDDNKALIAPSTLALHLYARAHGYLGTLSEFFASELKPYPNAFTREIRRILRWWKFWR